MPLGEIAGEIIGGLLRFVGNLIGEAILEMAIRGPGYLLCRLFNRDVDPESIWVVAAGIGFWLCVGAMGYFTYVHYFSKPSVAGWANQVGRLS